MAKQVYVSTIEGLLAALSGDLTTPQGGNKYQQVFLTQDLDFQDDNCYENLANKITYTTGVGFPVVFSSPVSFNGCGYAIRNLYQDKSALISYREGSHAYNIYDDYGYVGLVGGIGGNRNTGLGEIPTFKNLIIEDANLFGTGGGILAETCSNAIIENIQIKNCQINFKLVVNWNPLTNIFGPNNSDSRGVGFGGIIGRIGNSIIRNCDVEGLQINIPNTYESYIMGSYGDRAENYNVRRFVGGIAGVSPTRYVKIENCSAKGIINVPFNTSVAREIYMGGIVGAVFNMSDFVDYFPNLNIENCNSQIEINSPKSTKGFITYGKLTTMFSDSFPINIKNCLSIHGDIINTNGIGNNVIFENNLVDGTVSGLISSQYATVRTTAQLRQKINYFNNEDIRIVANTNYIDNIRNPLDIGETFYIIAGSTYREFNWKLLQSRIFKLDCVEDLIYGTHYNLDKDIIPGNKFKNKIFDLLDVANYEDPKNQSQTIGYFHVKPIGTYNKPFIGNVFNLKLKNYICYTQHMEDFHTYDTNTGFAPNGLFGYVGFPTMNKTIYFENLEFEDFMISGGTHGGSFIGYLDVSGSNSKIEFNNCRIKGVPTDTISEKHGVYCYCNTTTLPETYYGGFIGYAKTGGSGNLKFYRCGYDGFLGYNRMSGAGQNKTTRYFGGFIGYCEGGIHMESCRVLGTINSYRNTTMNSPMESPNYSNGGIIGYLTGETSPNDVDNTFHFKHVYSQVEYPRYNAETTAQIAARVFGGIIGTLMPLSVGRTETLYINKYWTYTARYLAKYKNWVNMTNASERINYNISGNYNQTMMNTLNHPNASTITLNTNITDLQLKTYSYLLTSAGYTGLLTDNFEFFDGFEWKMKDGEDYPRLIWEGKDNILGDLIRSSVIPVI